MTGNMAVGLDAFEGEKEGKGRRRCYQCVVWCTYPLNLDDFESASDWPDVFQSPAYAVSAVCDNVIRDTIKYNK